MYEVIFYKDKNGREPLKDYMSELEARSDKDSRIKLAKFYSHIDYLCEVGKAAREPYAKRLDGEIWELRPINDRILFAAWEGNEFILLHHFVKKTQKTPRKEIEQAKRNLASHKERSNKK
ncbi:MAG: type II toxin-antitoxin system RelE/ParE family toxin [Defluviitaleaceae bacterium]|nr:type II toxin-antitoxin system RelE/ParE family toxin [Defluviitaleaceae bacterium]